MHRERLHGSLVWCEEERLGFDLTGGLWFQDCMTISTLHGVKLTTAAGPKSADAS